MRRLLYGSRLDVPEALIVQTGVFRRREITVDISTVDAVLPSEEKLELAVTPLEADLAAILKNRVPMNGKHGADRSTAST